MVDEVSAKEAVEELLGRQFAVEAMLTHLISKWMLSQPHPPTALGEYLRPLEEGMAKMASHPNADRSVKAAQTTVREIALELERTLHKEALLRAGSSGQAQ
jgi:hypothetical protein